MAPRTTLRTTCNRDCPDACGILADVEDGRVVALRGDPEHPVTQGFLCYRTSRFLKRQYGPERITKPLLRRGDRQVEIPLDEALDLAAERLLTIRKESGPAAIMHYRSGGSLGLLKLVADHFFDRFGPTCTKRGDVCSGGGDEAQAIDFGRSDSNDVFDLRRAKHVLNWGKNLFVSNVHLVPLVKEARARGTKVITVDPAWSRMSELSDRMVLVRPGGDVALALAVLRVLFDSNRVAPEARSICDNLDALEAVAKARPLEDLLAESDTTRAEVEAIADALSDGPTTILVGWGMQRHALGGTAVRLLDALSAVSGNLTRPGGGVSFYYRRRGAFDTSIFAGREPPRTLSEPRLGEELLAAKDPPIRALWVTAGNPVVMLPDSRTVARAIETRELSIVVDAFHTDTTRRASLVLPATTLLEDDDLLGAYGHHYVSASRPVVPPPEGVLTELELFQALARRVGLTDALAGDARTWKTRLLRPAAAHGITLEQLEAGAVKSPFAKDVLFADGKVETPSGRVNLVAALPPRTERLGDGELHLMSASTEKSQCSQWSAPTEGLLPATVHPDTAGGLADGAEARLVNELGSLRVRLVLDARQRRDVVIVPKGGHLDRGWAANALVPARTTDLGEGAAYQAARVRLVAPT